MGLFGMFRAKETPSEPPKKEPSPFAPALIEIARIISGGDEEGNLRTLERFFEEHL